MTIEFTTQSDDLFFTSKLKITAALKNKKLRSSDQGFVFNLKGF